MNGGRMKTKKLEKIVKPGARGQITIPSEIRKKLNIDRKTILNVTLDKDNIVVTPLRLTEEKFKGRDYTEKEIKKFLKEDNLDKKTLAKAKKLLKLVG